jgi:hypothetical protein
VGSQRRHSADEEEIRTLAHQTHTSMGGFRPDLLVRMLRRRWKPSGFGSGNLRRRPFGIAGT